MSVLVYAWILFATLIVGAGCWIVGEHIMAAFRSNDELTAAKLARGKWLKSIDKPHAYVTIALMVVFALGALFAVSFFSSVNQ